MKSLKSHIAETLYGNAITTAVRIAMGAVFLLSGVLSSLDPAAFGAAVARYGLVPAMLVPYAAILIPSVEVVIGLCLIMGYRTRAAALLGTVLLATFIAAMVYALSAGKSFDCGCFDVKRFGIEFDETIGPKVIARNALFIAALTLVFRARRHVLSLENYRDRLHLTNLS